MKYFIMTEMFQQRAIQVNNRVFSLHSCNLRLAILVTVIAYEPVAAVDVNVGFANLRCFIVEVASRTGVVGVLSFPTVPILAAVLWVGKISQLINSLTETSVTAVEKFSRGLWAWSVFSMTSIWVIARP